MEKTTIEFFHAEHNGVRIEFKTPIIADYNPQGMVIRGRNEGTLTSRHPHLTTFYGDLDHMKLILARMLVDFWIMSPVELQSGTVNFNEHGHLLSDTETNEIGNSIAYKIKAEIQSHIEGTC